MWGGLLVAAALAIAIGGCGGSDPNAAGASEASALTIYSSLPLQGPDAQISAEIVNGERLALAQAGGHVGRLHVGLVSLDDADPTTGTWNPAVTSTAARTASQDKSAIAFVGDYDSGASAISLPLVNEAGILQISPASPYVGLTSALDAGKGEPERYYPTGLRTFARLAPDDAQQARAQVAYMRSVGVRKLLVVGDSDVFSSDIAAIVARQAPSAGITVVRQIAFDRTTDPASIARQVRADSPDAVFLAGDPSPATVAAARAILAIGMPPRLFLPAGLAAPAFVRALAPPPRRVYATSPTLPARMYPATAQRFFKDYLTQFGARPSPYALYGYEAVRATLAAIRAAGSHGADRASVQRAFFAIHDRDSVLGRYSVLPSGDTTLSQFAGYRVSGGRLVFDRLLPAGP